MLVANSLPLGSLPLVVELVGSALRADAAAASVYLQAVRSERRALSSLDIAILVILGSRRGDRGSVYGESTALSLSHSFSHTNLKSPCAEQG